jgi:adenosylmethionine-8-amino-7-oxononanoate aminotransferase
VHEARGEGPTWPSDDTALRERALHEAVDELASVLERLGDRCAGLVVEPLIQGASGIYEHPEGFLKAAWELARAHGVPLVADEVAVGFGRAGGLFACDVEGVTPDILCLGKGITGGYMPLAATLIREDIAASFDGAEGEYRTFFHGHTYTGNPLACVAGLASLDLLLERGVVEHATSVGEAMRSMFRKTLSEHPNVGDIRGRGVITGIELVRSRSPHEAFDRTMRISYRVCDIARESGAIVRPLGDVLVLNPAPAMDAKTARELASATIDAIKSFDFEAI